MTTTQNTYPIPIRHAMQILTHHLALADDVMIEQIRTILEQGAGLMGLPDGVTLTEPAGLVPARRELWATLSDTIRLDSGRGPDGETVWSPSESGAWESVLVSLIVEEKWTAITRTATTVRADAPR